MDFYDFSILFTSQLNFLAKQYSLIHAYICYHVKSTKWEDYLNNKKAGCKKICYMQYNRPTFLFVHNLCKMETISVT